MERIQGLSLLNDKEVEILLFKYVCLTVVMFDIHNIVNTELKLSTT